MSGDRGEFLGRNGNPADPACMTRSRLSGRVGAGIDPCAAMQAPIDLADGQEREIAFTFGTGRDLTDTRNLVTRFHGIGAARAALEAVWTFWNRTLGVRPRRDSGCIRQFPGQRLVAVPGARLARSGGAAGSTNPAGPSASAINSRT